jgi:predicted amidohydrolase
MVEMTLTVPDQLAARLQPMTDWLPTVLELSLQGFKTPAAQTLSEIITFLSAGPTARQVAAFMVSERAQERLKRLLALNQAGLLSQAEQDELDELEQLEHIMVLLKAQAHKRVQETSQ